MRERCISCLARLLSATDVWVETYYLLSLAKSFSHSIFTVAAVVSPAVRRLRASPTKTVCCHHHPQRAQKRFRRGGRCRSSRRLKKKLLLLTRFGDHSISLCVVEVATFFVLMMFWGSLLFENDRDEKNRLDDNWAMMRLNSLKAMLESLLCGGGLFPISVHYVWTQQHDNLILITTHLGIYQIKIPISLASICFA